MMETIPADNLQEPSRLNNVQAPAAVTLISATDEEHIPKGSVSATVDTSLVSFLHLI